MYSNLTDFCLRRKEEKFFNKNKKNKQEKKEKG